MSSIWLCLLLRGSSADLSPAAGCDKYAVALDLTRLQRPTCQHTAARAAAARAPSRRLGQAVMRQPDMQPAGNERHAASRRLGQAVMRLL